MTTYPLKFVPLDYILSTFPPAYGETFEGAFSIIDSNTYEAERMERLRAELRANGSFRQPVILCYDDPSDEDAERGIMNGMHRLYAHYAEGIEDVLVIDEDNWRNIHPDTDTISVEFIICNIDGNNAVPADDDVTWEAFHSFPVGDHEWSETDIFVGNGKNNETLEGCYYWYSTRVPELITALHEQAKRSNLTIEIIRVGQDIEVWGGNDEYQGNIFVPLRYK